MEAATAQHDDMPKTTLRGVERIIVRHHFLLPLVLCVACAPLGPASREGLGVPVVSLAAARAIADSIGTPVWVVVDTLVLLPAEPLPTPREIARVRLVRGRRDGCRVAPGQAEGCPTVIFVETRRPPWTPR
jgi:hypothetical protein